MKYKLTEEFKMYSGHKVYRIQSTSEFADVYNGELGGWVESENNLSKEGDCWIYDDAIVMGDAVVKGNAKVCDNAVVSDSARILGDARVRGCAKISGAAVISSNAFVHGEAKVSGYAHVGGNADVSGTVFIGQAVCIGDDAKVSGDIDLFGNAKVYNNAVVTKNSDIVVIKPHWTELSLVWTKSNGLWIYRGTTFTTPEILKYVRETFASEADRFEKLVEVMIN